MKDNKFRQYITIALLILILASCRSQKFQPTVYDLTHPKREFRGAWLSTAWQTRYKDMNNDELKAYFIQSLDQLKSAGINAIIFQVRPQADAFYKSKYEPWSQHLTGTEGVAPADGFDPLKFLIDEAHSRNMELHAWLNPYRVTISANQIYQLPNDHLYHQHPERFVNYDGKLYFDPGQPVNRKHIRKIVQDIILNYNVDAIHMDDYFYPYPVAGRQFPDDDSYAQFGKKFTNKADWRRNNVNLLVKEIKQTILDNKPWVRFGISPFGIYRNKKSDSEGSETNGLQNYDDLYADVKLWVKNSWIDYNMPQLYWEIGHRSADYSTLLKWWNENNYKAHLYIGQDVVKSMDKQNAASRPQLEEKISATRSLEHVHGNSFWPAYPIIENYMGVTDRLHKVHHKYPALIPAYTHMHSKLPKEISKLRVDTKSDNVRLLNWTSNHEDNNPESAQYYVIYQFTKDEKEDLNNAQRIVEITKKTYYILPYKNGGKEYKYVVTSVDGFHNESKGKNIKIKL